MSDQEKTFLGRGWHFPPTFDKYSQSVQMIANEEDIKESIGILLSTTPGERIMAPGYGADTRRLLFEPLDLQLQSYMESMMSDAITRYEPRVRLESLRLVPIAEEGKIEINVEYTIVTTNTRYNNVYPYYVNEANNL